MITAINFSGGSDGKKSTCNVGDPGSIPGSGRPPGEEHDNLLQYSSLENPQKQMSLMGCSLLQEGGHLPGLESRLLSNTEMNDLRRHIYWQSKRLYWEGAPGQRASWVREPKKITLPHGSQSQVLWWMDKFLGFLWSFILSPSWWCTHCSAKMDASEKYSGR